MNSNIYTGRPVKDPDIFYSGNDEDKKVTARFTLAVKRNFAKEGDPQADFIPCVAFGKIGKVIADYVKKGSHILVKGRLQNNDYEKDGQKIYGFQVFVESIEFLGHKPSGNEGGKEPDSSLYGTEFMNIPENIEELPFL